MTGPRSLRTRLLLAALLWTAGLIVASHLFAVAVMRTAPNGQTRRIAHYAALSVAAVGIMTMALSLLRRGLAPLDHLRERLKRVRDGGARHLEGAYPSEVQPLVDDLNALLDHRDEAVRRAQSRAGDLAHGLKTPLAVLAHEADRAAAAGHDVLAATLGQQIERMRRQLEYHLAQARAAASGAAPGVRCAVRDSAEGLARTLLRLHAERGIAIEVHVPPDHSFRGQRQDLDEMLGNLLDNACHWARTRVAVESACVDGVVIVTVDDDGPGLAPELRHRVLQRGVRADEASPGSGLGLAIVRDLAAAYGGTIALEASPAGGLRARLELPG